MSNLPPLPVLTVGWSFNPPLIPPPSYRSFSAINFFFCSASALKIFKNARIFSASALNSLFSVCRSLRYFLKQRCPSMSIHIFILLMVSSSVQVRYMIYLSTLCWTLWWLLLHRQFIIISLVQRLGWSRNIFEKISFLYSRFWPQTKFRFYNIFSKSIIYVVS